MMKMIPVSMLSLGWLAVAAATTQQQPPRLRAAQRRLVPDESVPTAAPVIVEYWDNDLPDDLSQEEEEPIAIPEKEEESPEQEESPLAPVIDIPAVPQLEEDVEPEKSNNNNNDNDGNSSRNSMIKYSVTAVALILAFVSCLGAMVYALRVCSHKNTTHLEGLEKEYSNDPTDSSTENEEPLPPQMIDIEHNQHEQDMSRVGHYEGQYDDSSSSSSDDDDDDGSCYSSDSGSSCSSSGSSCSSGNEDEQQDDCEKEDPTWPDSSVQTSLSSGTRKTASTTPSSTMIQRRNNIVMPKTLGCPKLDVKQQQEQQRAARNKKQQQPYPLPKGKSVNVTGNLPETNSPKHDKDDDNVADDSSIVRNMKKAAAGLRGEASPDAFQL